MMRLSTLFSALILSLSAAPLAAQPATQPTTTTDSRLAPYLQAIDQAPDPSSAIAAYARAFAVAPDNTRVQNALLRRMVDLRIPEMADAQAQEPIKREPGNGLAWAVNAYMNAMR